MSFELTNDQRMFLNLYSRHYAQLQDQISRLQDQISRLIPISNEIRHNIQTIYSDVIRADDRRRYASQTRSSAPAIPMSSIPTQSASVAEQPNTYSVVFSVEEPVDLMQTETTRRTFSDIENPLNTECPIRIEPFQPDSEVVQINRCGHIFYHDELNHWLQSDTRCPICRTQLRQRQQQQQRQQSNENMDQLLTTMLYELLLTGVPSGSTGGSDLSGNPITRRNQYR